MPQWNHTLKIKELFEHDAEDHDEVARRIGPIVSGRVRKLAEKIKAEDPDLSSDLEESADYFADCEDEEQAQRMFNDALAELYDIGDQHRIWIS